MSPGATRDIWAEWLLKRRFGGADPEDVLAKLRSVRDAVLDAAAVGPEDVVLDVGAGDGLIAFGALERGAREVVFSDISADLLERSRELAVELGVLDRCRFVEAAAEDMSAIADESVDAVTTRSVLIYVKRKEDAFAEFARVLRPGGRIALWEPINRFGVDLKGGGRLWSFDAAPVRELAERVRAVFDEIQPPEDPMLDFDERDLLVLAEEAGFYPVVLSYEAEVRPTEPVAWDRIANTAGNPRIPTLAEAMAQVLSPAEQEELTRHLRPQAEEGRGTWRMAHALLRGTKPL